MCVHLRRNWYLFLCWICDWLLCVDGKHPACDQSYFGRREFSFTLDNDIYLRFQSFNSASELENSIKEKCPFKIDIGPVYSVDVRFLLDYSYNDDSIHVFDNSYCFIDITCPHTWTWIFILCSVYFFLLKMMIVNVLADFVLSSRFFRLNLTILTEDNNHLFWYILAMLVFPNFL